MRSASRVCALLLAVAGAASTGACGGADPIAEASSPAAPTKAAEPRLQLAARAAAAQDLRQVAQYAFRANGRPQRTVVVTLAADDTWRVDVQGGALGGTVDIALVRTGGKTYHCALASTAYPTPGCVEVTKMSKTFDPLVWHLFTDWLTAFTDRDMPLVVSKANSILGTTGTCFSVDSSTVSVTSPVDAGIYCYADDGTLTAAKVSFGTLALVAPPAAGPPTVTLPAAVVPGKPLPIASPSPSPSPSASGSLKPSPKPSA
ncbi:hypothetical protein F4553_004582 [Allocatelliglobosispora scoriae]|uniref:Lipoprotein n=1 Tax=Allocatelliglobosispora scoriae TaxID=643052 RepID=A0A841BWA1_9ACTN|nr:hypothetical protein [Allocatelliglobosispora scoriae]MBB5871203.1 hypothetical protein [Allocatelliglobosispora scoriae]